MTIRAQELEGLPRPACRCSREMALVLPQEVYACPATIDESGWGRPTKDHDHYLPAEQVHPNERSTDG